MGVRALCVVFLQTNNETGERHAVAVLFLVLLASKSFLNANFSSV